MTGYKYRLYKLGDNSVLYEQTLSGADNTKVTIRDLEPNQYYGFTVAAIANNTVCAFTPRRRFKTAPRKFSDYD